MSTKKDNAKKPLIKKKETKLKVESPKEPSAEEEVAEMDSVDSGPYSSIFGYD